MIEAAVRFLLAGQNADGGWGARAGRSSSTEATCFAAMALSAIAGGRPRSGVERARQWLARHQNPDGSWPVNGHLAQGAWVTSLATLALDVLGADPSRITRGATWLALREGRPFGWLPSLLHRLAPQSLAVRQDPDLKGWPWEDGTASFVEPTAHAVLALKKVRRHLGGQRVEERIRQGELMIYDRMCEGGGWNYGNSRVFDVALSPFADVTALTLIALQDHATTAANQKSLRALRDLLARVDSGLALGWGALCFAVHGEDVSTWRRRLAERYRRTGFLGDTRSVALALLAFTEGPRLFRL